MFLLRTKKQNVIIQANIYVRNYDNNFRLAWVFGSKVSFLHIEQQFRILEEPLKNPWIRQWSGSHRAVIRQSLGSHQSVSHQAVIGQSLDSHRAVIRECHRAVIGQSSGSHQAVIGQSLAVIASHQAVIRKSHQTFINMIWGTAISWSSNGHQTVIGKSSDCHWTII